MQTSTEQMNISFDDVDLRILRLLQNNSKLTVREIAQQVHLSTTPVHERIKRLEKSGIIKQYVTLLNGKLLGQVITVFCHISLKEHDKKLAKSFIQAVGKFDEVLECYNVSGEYDFILKIVSENMETYHQFYLNKLSEIKGIGQTKSTFVMDVIKETHKII